MAEWSIAPHSKCGVRASVPGVRIPPSPPEWLLVEWPQGESAPTKYWLSTLPADADLETLVSTAKLRWRIERDYQELKQELGLDHYEGRGWRGFHHHMALCVAAYGFLVSERSLTSPLRRQNPARPGASPIPELSTPRIPRSEPNATSKRQSQPSALSSPATSPDACPVVLVANEPTYDTVRLGCRVPEHAWAPELLDLRRELQVGVFLGAPKPVHVPFKDRMQVAADAGVPVVTAPLERIHDGRDRPAERWGKMLRERLPALVDDATVEDLAGLWLTGRPDRYRWARQVDRLDLGDLDRAGCLNRGGRCQSIPTKDPLPSLRFVQPRVMMASASLLQSSRFI